MYKWLLLLLQKLEVRKRCWCVGGENVQACRCVLMMVMMKMAGSF
jgi:hypothetical protein